MLQSLALGARSLTSNRLRSWTLVLPLRSPRWAIATNANYLTFIVLVEVPSERKMQLNFFIIKGLTFAVASVSVSEASPST